MSLTNRILLAMAAGVAIGSGMEWFLAGIDPADPTAQFINDWFINGFFHVVGRIFIASLKLLVVPLVLVSLICGMTSLGSGNRMGAIAGRTVGLYIVTTAIA